MSASDVESEGLIGDQDRYSGYPFADIYKIKTMVLETSTTLTYQAWDRNLHREVLLVALKEGASAQEGRHFLLHARTLGQLHNSGILPIYDMGIHEGKYYYTCRVPPAKTLQKQLTKNLAAIADMKNRPYRMRILLRVAETLAYAHENAVTIGRLDFDSIIVGKHGEVLIVDWSHGKWLNDSDDSDVLPSEWMREDLRVLAAFGLKLMFYRDPPKQLDLSHWVEWTGTLSGDFQMILDRAFLERPEPYKSVDDFAHDLTRHLAGYPLALQKGDALVMLQGLFRRNIKTLSLFICLLLLGGASIVWKMQDLQESRKRLALKQGNIREVKASLEAYKTGNEDLTKHQVESEARVDFFRAGVQEHRQSSLREQENLGQIRQDHQNVSLEFSTLKEHLQSRRESLGRFREDRAAMDQREGKLTLEIEREIAQAQSALELRRTSWLAELDPLMDQLDKWPAKNFMAYIEKSQFEAWLADALKARYEAGLPVRTHLSNLSPSSNPIATSRDGATLAWMNRNKLMIYLWKGSQLLQFDTQYKADELVFSSDDKVLLGVSGTNRLVRLRWSPDKKLESHSVVWKPKTYGAPLAYTPPEEIWAHGREGLFCLKMNRKGMAREPEKWEAPVQNIESVQIDPGNYVMAFLDKRHTLHLYKPRSDTALQRLSRPQAGHWGFLKNQGCIHFISGSTFSLFNAQTLISQGQWSLGGDVQRVCEIPGTSRVYLEAAGRTLLLDWIQQPAIVAQALPLQGSSVAAAWGDKTILRDPGGELWIETEPEKPNAEKLQVWKKMLEERPVVKTTLDKNRGILITRGETTHVFADASVTDLTLPDEQGPLALLIRDKRHIEVWNILTNRKIWTVGRAKEDLSRVMYLPEERKIATLDAKGTIGLW